MDLKLPQWASAPPTGFPGAIEPPTGKQEEGWDNGEEPTAGHCNWIFQAVADTQNELTNAITGTGGTLDGADVTQLLGMVQRQSLKSALAGLKLIEDLGAGVLKGIARSRTGKIVAVGEDALIVSSNGYVAFGTETADSPYTGDFNDIVYDAFNAKFIAVGTGGMFQTSSGNGTWTAHGTGGGQVFNAIATDGAGNSVAVGNSEAIFSSANGVSWASRTSPFAGTPAIVGVAYGAGVFVCVTNTGDTAYSSNSGLSWTLGQAIAGSVSAGGGPKVGYHSSLGFIYHWGTKVYRSADGSTWTTLHNTASTSTETPGLLVAPYCWLLGRASGGAGTAVDARFSPTAVDAAVDFRADFIIDEGLSYLKLVDGQLMGLANSKIYIGGVL